MDVDHLIARFVADKNDETTVVTGNALLQEGAYARVDLLLHDVERNLE